MTDLTAFVPPPPAHRKPTKSPAAVIKQAEQDMKVKKTTSDLRLQVKQAPMVQGVSSLVGGGTHVLLDFVLNKTMGKIPVVKKWVKYGLLAVEGVGAAVATGYNSPKTAGALTGAFLVNIGSMTKGIGSGKGTSGDDDTSGDEDTGAELLGADGNVIRRMKHRENRRIGRREAIQVGAMLDDLGLTGGTGEEMLGAMWDEQVTTGGPASLALKLAAQSIKKALTDDDEETSGDSAMDACLALAGGSEDMVTGLSRKDKRRAVKELKQEYRGEKKEARGQRRDDRRDTPDERLDRLELQLQQLLEALTAPKE